MKEKDSVAEKRRYVRRKFHSTGFIYDVKTKTKIACATFDISAGGMRVITDRNLSGKEYDVIINKTKLPTKVVYKERRESSMMDKDAYYYGLEFKKPLSEKEQKSLFSVAQSVF